MKRFLFVIIYTKRVGNKMMKKLTDFFGDKRIAYIYVVVIVVLLSGVTYALNPNSVALNITTGLIGIDEEYYGDTTFDSSDITLTPILDTEVETRLENVIKIDFTVGGASTNNANNIIYDIALVDFKIDCGLINEYFKWKLVKDGEVLYSNNFTFDAIDNGRLVLTDTQLDLPGNSSTQEGYHNYSFYIWLSDSCQEDSIEDCNTTVDQNYLLGKMFSGKIEVELYTESKKVQERTSITSASTDSCVTNYVPATTFIKNLYNDGSAINSVNIGGDTTRPQVHLNANQGIMLDNNGIYRYYGKNPNNYVSFNDELWRIISVENVKSNINDKDGSIRLKIVKADMLTDDNGLKAYSWDSSPSTINSGDGVNDWSQADLMTELNTLYLNSTSGKCYTGWNDTTTDCNFTNSGLSEEARNLTGDALYYLGGIDSYGYYANDYYVLERSNNVWGSNLEQTCNDGACPRATTWTGKIGLMYPSDYLYSRNFNETECNATSDYINCNERWIKLDDDHWLITPTASNLRYALFLDNGIYLDDPTNVVAFAYKIQPVLYLRPTVSIVDGEGTSDLPYILE